MNLRNGRQESSTGKGKQRREVGRLTVMDILDAFWPRPMNGCGPFKWLKPPKTCPYSRFGSLPRSKTRCQVGKSQLLSPDCLQEQKGRAEVVNTRAGRCESFKRSHLTEVSTQPSTTNRNTNALSTSVPSNPGTLYSPSFLVQVLRIQTTNPHPHVRSQEENSSVHSNF